MCKKLIYLISFVLALSLAGTAQAADNTWTNGTGNRLWNDAGNWSLGHVPAYDNDEGQYIGMTPGPVVVATGMGADGIIMQNTSDLTIDGGTLLLSSNFDIASGSGSVSTVTVNSGTFEQRWDGNRLVQVGRNGEGTLNMNGGAFIAENILVGVYDGAIGHVQLDGGVITAGTFSMRPYDDEVGTMDITGGTMIIDGNSVETVQGYIDNGWITAYGGTGTDTLQLDYDVTNTGKTTLKVVPHYLNPIPANGSTVPTTLNQLQWTLPEPNEPGDVVTCDVYFGTNPSIWDNPKIVGDPDPEAVESVSVTLAGDTTYYWAIVLYDSGIPDGWYYYSPVFTFYAVDNFPPIVNAGDDVATWLANGERVVQLDGSASDDGQIEALSYEWTVITEPDELNPATFDDATLPNATVTVRVPGSYTLQLEAGDGEYTVTDTMRIALYADSCEHAQNQEGFEWLATDINHDCKVDFVDIANLAATWLEEYYSTE